MWPDSYRHPFVELADSPNYNCTYVKELIKTKLNTQSSQIPTLRLSASSKHDTPKGNLSEHLNTQTRIMASAV